MRLTRFNFSLLVILLLPVLGGAMKKSFESDLFKTSVGDLTITFIGHGTLMMEIDGKIIHIDPVMREADYRELPPADLILVTHDHFDHLDQDAIQAVWDDNTEMIYTKNCASAVMSGTVMANGELRNLEWVLIEAVPAYNIVNQRAPGRPYHPKGVGNGYVLTFGDFRVYVAGDTENIPEMEALRDIDVAFLPMNLPYTMTPEMVADAAITFRPRILYPYHYGDTDPQELVKLLEFEKDIEVRVRQLQ